MRGRDITPHNARIDHLFDDSDVPSVGIGDGGNEIGMGNLADEVTQVESLVKLPCVTQVDKLMLASVSNWGGYGLVAALSELSGRNLLPGVADHRRLIEQTVDLGAVDGMSSQQEYKVDGFTVDENLEDAGGAAWVSGGRGGVGGVKARHSLAYIYGIVYAIHYTSTFKGGCTNEKAHRLSLRAALLRRRSGAGVRPWR